MKQDYDEEKDETETASTGGKQEGGKRSRLAEEWTRAVKEGDTILQSSTAEWDEMIQEDIVVSDQMHDTVFLHDTGHDIHDIHHPRH